jgi:hypothetical protein
MTLDEILAANHKTYVETRMLYLRGEISQDIWLKYCEQFLNMILTCDDIRAMFERMKNDQTAN